VRESRKFELAHLKKKENILATFECLLVYHY